MSIRPRMPANPRRTATAWTPLAAVLFLTAASPALAQITLRDSFDSAEPAWQEAGGDARYRLQTHLRVARDARAGACEMIELVAGHNGTFIHFGYDVGRARVIAELVPTLWVRCDRPGPRLMARIVLPRTRDPKTGQPITRLVGTAAYQRVGQWQQLRVDGLDRLLAEQARALRAQLSVDVDAREAYVDRLLLNVYGGAGRTRVWIDELEVAGFIESPSPAGQLQLAGLSSAPGTGQSASHRIQFSGKLLLIDGQPMFPRIVEHCGEPLAFLKDLGFNAVKLAQVPGEQLLAEARAADIWLVAPPPRPARLGQEPSTSLDWAQASEDALLGRFDDRYGPVLLWHLGSGLTVRELETTRRWADQVDRADAPHPRPLVCGADAELLAYSRVVDVLSMERAPIGTTFELADYGTWLRERPRLARAGTPFLAAVQTQPATELSQQVALASSGRSSPPVVETEQMRLLVQAGLAAGCRGICFLSHARLDAADAATRERAAALESLNLDLQLVENFLAHGTLSASVPSSDPAVIGAVIQTDRSRLLLPIWLGGASQFVPGESAGNSIHFVVPGVPEAIDAWWITPAGIRRLDAQRKTGGVRIAVDELDLSGQALLSGDQRAISLLTRRAAASGQRAATLQRELAAFKFARTAGVQDQLARAGRRLPDGPAWLAAAQRSLDSADQALADRDYHSAWLSAQRAMRPLRLLARSHWQQAASSLGSPMAGPLSAGLATLPEHWLFVERLNRFSQSPAPPNLLPAGDLEDLDATLAAGWRLFEHPQPNILTLAELSGEAPHSGGYSLRLSARPSDKQAAPLLVETAPLWLVSPPVMLRAGQLVRISGWLRIASPITGSLDGLMIIDSIGGEPMAERIGQSSQWRPFVLYRIAPGDGPLTVTFALTGLGDASIDDLSIQPIPD